MMLCGFLQFPVAFADSAANHRQIREALEGQRFDLLVLPELCASGYFHSSCEAMRPYAESAYDGPTARLLIELSKIHDATLVAGIAELDGELLYNTAIVVSRGRWLGKQRKIHLSRLEQPLFTPGTSLTVFADGRCRFGVLTCFDVWVPEAARLLMRQGAQLFCVPANYGGPWTSQLVRSRAMENAMPLICCNRTGSELYGGNLEAFRGESQVVDTMGNVLTSATEQTCLGLWDIDPTSVRANPMCADLRAEAERYPLSGPLA